MLSRQYAYVDRVRRLEAMQANLRHSLSNESLSLFPDFQYRLRKCRQTGLGCVLGLGVGVGLGLESGVRVGITDWRTECGGAAFGRPTSSSR